MTTPKLNLAEIAESQSSKYVTHNEALRLLDVAANAAVIRQQVEVPSSTFSDGNAYIVASAPSAGSAWAGQTANIAYYFNSAWEFVSSIYDGFQCYDNNLGTTVVFDNGIWRPDNNEALVSVNVSAGQTSINLDMHTGNIFHVVLQADASVQFTNPPATGKNGKIILYLEQDGTGSRAFNLIDTVLFANGAASTITATASAKDIWTYTTINNGAEWYGEARGRNFD